jgi:hypothetical protein
MSNYKTPITKRRKLLKVELQNVELQNVEIYERKNNKRSKIPKPNKRSKITKSRKRRENTVQYGKNPRKNFSTENQKGGEKFPWAFFFKLTVVWDGLYIEIIPNLTLTQPNLT